MRIFIGVREIANLTYTYSQGFQELGHEIYTYILKRNPFYLDSEYSRVLYDVVSPDLLNQGFWKRIAFTSRKWVDLVSTFLKVLFTCDVVIYVFGSSLLPYYLDYTLYTLFGKRIVSVFLGSDIRYWYAYEQEMSLLGLSDEYRQFIETQKTFDYTYSQKMKTIQAAERYADLILSMPSMAQLQSRPYMRVNLPIDLTQYHFNFPGREVPLIIHAPSRRSIKGTDIIISAIEQLKSEGVPFQFELIEKMPNTRLREEMANADIVIDQLFSSSLATFALEAMASGNAVLAKYVPSFTKVPPGCPAVNVNVDNLADKLREVILDVELRRQLAHAGRSYVEKYHNHLVVCAQILEWLELGGIRQYDFTPTFFKNDFKMSTEILDAERKRMKDQRRAKIKSLFKGS